MQWRILVVGAALCWSGTAFAGCEGSACPKSPLQQVWAKVTQRAAAPEAAAAAPAARKTLRTARHRSLKRPASTRARIARPAARPAPRPAVALPPVRPATFAERFTDGAVRMVAPETPNEIDLAADAHDAVAGALASARTGDPAGAVALSWAPGPASAAEGLPKP